jgi:hypothetical protein
MRRPWHLSNTCFLALSILPLLCVEVPRLGRQTQSQRETIYVGFIQDDRLELARKNANDSDPAKNRVIIAAFSREANGWKTLDRLTRNVKWTIAFDGRNLGEVETRPSPASEMAVNPNPADASSTYAHAVQTICTPEGKVPAIGKPGNKFAGAFETVVRRPLVVVSQPNFMDPDRWKPATVPAELAQPVRVAFGQAHQHVRQCDSQGEPLKQDWDVPESELAIVGTYASNKGSFLVETQLKHHHCVFDIGEKNLTNLEGTQWFFVDRDRAVRSLGNDWQLVDAGDYDADGKSEVVFFFGDSETGREAYILFYDDFQSQVTWSYPSRAGS